MMQFKILNQSNNLFDLKSYIRHANQAHHCLSSLMVYTMIRMRSVLENQLRFDKFREIFFFDCAIVRPCFSNVTSKYDKVPVSETFLVFKECLGCQDIEDVKILGVYVHGPKKNFACTTLKLMMVSSTEHERIAFAIYSKLIFRFPLRIFFRKMGGYVS